MKKLLPVLAVLLCVGISQIKAQAIYAPITTTNYNYDAVAETTPSSLTTTGAIDGSNYIMHSVAYASLYSMTVGLPNSGQGTVPNHTFQMQPYTQNNMLFLTFGQTDSIIIVSPAPYNGLSVMGMATEGAGTMNVTVRFTDNTTQVFSNVSVPDWFTGGSTVLSSFGRTNRTTGVISNPTNAPNLYYFDFILTCANRVKNVKNIKFSNTGTNPRICMMAVSGAVNASTVTLGSNPVSCSGGINGSASVTVSGGTPPFTYSWSTTPPQLGSQANALGVGSYTCIVTDAGGCSTTNTVAVSQSLTAQPPLYMSSNGTSVCVGNTVALLSSGATSYSWSTGSTLQLIVVSPTVTTTYTVGGYSTANCFLTGSITISAFPSPVVSVTPLPPSLCLNSPVFPITTTPVGGTISGVGLTPGGFDPSVAGVGAFSIFYSYTDANGCSGSYTTSTVVNPLPVVNLSVTPTSFCNNSPSLALTGSGTPSGGVFSGNGTSGGAFNPSTAGTGNSVITYSYTDSNNCSSTATTAVSVSSLAAPSVTVAKKFFCDNSPSILVSGSPTTGTFSGTGITTGGLFSPTLAGAGVYNLTYSITSGPCMSSSAISVTVSACEGIGERSGPALITIYPNPNNGSFTLKALPGTQIEMFNELGQIISMEGLKQDENILRVEGLASGLYYVKVVNGSQSSVQKVLVTKQ